MSGGFLTTKALANRMKSKGLQRLRWYCQMCEKQCRDENGFKCHTRTEAHLRQMSLFASSADSFVERFSAQFCDGYMAVLRRQGGRRVKANQVYTAYIADKEHVHMNSTKWDTLSSFASYLGKQRLAEVDQDEHGDYFVRYIDRDPRALQRQQEREAQEGKERSREQQEARRLEAEMDEAQRAQRLRQSVERGDDTTGAAESGGGVDSGAMQAEDERRQREWLASDGAATAAAGRLTLSLGQPSGGSTQVGSQPAADRRPALLFAADGRSTRAEAAEAAAGPLAGKRKVSALEAIMQQEQQRKQRLMAAPLPAAPAAAAADDSAWLSVGLVVKLVGRAVQGGRYSGHKARVEAVADGGRSGTIAPLDPSLPPLAVRSGDCQTVIPAVGQPVRLVAGGRRRGERATLCGLTADESACSVRMDSDGQRLDAVEFEHVCKCVD